MARRLFALEGSTAMYGLKNAAGLGKARFLPSDVQDQCSKGILDGNKMLIPVIHVTFWMNGSMLNAIQGQVQPV